MKVEKQLNYLGKAERRHPWAFIAAVVVFTLLMISGFSSIETSTSFSDALPEGIQVLDAIEVFGNEFSINTENIILIVQIDQSDPDFIDDVRDPEVLKAVKQTLEKIETIQNIEGSNSLVDIVNEDGFIPSNKERIKKIIDKHPLKSRYVNSDYSVALSFIILNGDIEQQEMFDIAESIIKIVDEQNLPPGIKLKLSGTAVEQVEIDKTIGNSIGSTTIIGFAGVFIILFLFFRRFTNVVLTVLPVVFGTMWTFGTMGLLGIPMSTVLSGVFSMIIGIGIDFGLHILHRYDEEKAVKHKDPVVESVKHVGKGLLLTTITTIIGFLAMLTGTLTTLNDFSVVLSLGVFYSFITSIILVPSLLVLKERRENR